MIDTIYNKIRSKLILSISGKNIDRFIKRLATNNINILNMKKVSYNKIRITIYKSDYEKLKSIKTTYNINIDNELGLIKVKKRFIFDLPIIISIIICLVFLTFLFNTIFDIKVIHTDSKIREIILTELENYDIKKYSLKKSYDYIEKVKNKILEKYKDKIEWLEIEKVGVNYYVRVELREIIDNNEDDTKRHIVAKKDGIIKSIYATSGVVEKEINSYVKKGDIIINGNIKLNEDVKSSVKSIGKVYAEVWYEVSVEYPLTYKEVKYTNNKKDVYTIKIFNKRLELFNFKPFKEKEIKEKIILNNDIIPISLVKERQTEVKKVDTIYTEDEAIKGAVNLARDKINSNLSSKEYIISEKVLNVLNNSSKIEVDVFLTVYEDITDYEKIEKIEKNKEE